MGLIDSQIYKYKPIIQNVNGSSFFISGSLPPIRSLYLNFTILKRDAKIFFVFFPQISIQWMMGDVFFIYFNRFLTAFKSFIPLILTYMRNTIFNEIKFIIFPFEFRFKSSIWNEKCLNTRNYVVLLDFFFTACHLRYRFWHLIYDFVR